MGTFKHIACLAVAWAVAAGTARAEVWTLDQCIDYAIEHNIQVRLSQTQQQTAELSVTEARSRYLPTLNAGAGQSWNIGRGLSAENTYVNRNNSTFNWQASLNVPIFSGLSTERQIAYAKANLAQLTEQYEAAKEDITVNVITGYLQILYNRELHEVALQQVDLSLFELNRRQALVDAGKIPEVDMLEARSQLANDQLNVAQTLNDLTLARLDLARLLQIDGDFDSFDVAPLADKAMLLVAPDEAYQRALQHNHSISAAQRGIDASERNIALARSGYLPTLSFNAGIGSSYYKISGMPNESFGAQMRHNYSTYFGFQLNVPIFDGLSTRNQVRRAEAGRITAELQLDQARQELYRTIQQAYYQALGSQQKLEASRVAEESALRAFEAMREKYNIGRATPTEYEQSKAKALRATADRIQADYELILRSRLLAFYAGIPIPAPEHP